MNGRFRIIIAWAAIVLGLTTPALALDPARSLTQYAHRIWTEEGLPQPTIYAIHQTSDGFLWIGTQDGLLRFDGVNFTPFPGVDHSFEHTLVRALSSDRSGALWAASIGSGILRINHDGSSLHFDSRNGLPSDDIFCLVTDLDGSFWACTNEGLVRHRETVWRKFTTAAGLASNRVRAFCRATDGTEWVAAADAPLTQGRNGHFSPFTQERGPALPSASTALACTSDGSVWVGTENGLYRIIGSETRRYSTQDGLLDDAVAVLTEGPHGSLWIGTRNGVNRFHPTLDGSRQISTFSTSDGLSHSGVQALFVDREENVWAGTKGGLDHFTNGNQTLYTTHEGLPSNDIGPVAQDPRGHLWVGVQGKGLAEFDGRRFHVLSKSDGLAGVHVSSFEIDERGDVWVGSEGGVNRIHQDRVAGSWTGARAPYGRGVRTLFFDRQGRLWAGTDLGLSTLRGQAFVAFKPSNKNLTDVVSLAEATPGSLLVSTNHDGLYSIETSASKAFAASIDLSGPTRAVTATLVDRESKGVWFATLGSGLVFWRDGKAIHIRTKDGLYDSRLYGLVADDDANYWFASSKGIFSVSRSSLLNFVDGRAHRVESNPFQTGQLRFECQPDVQPSAVRGRMGRFWFATDHGLLLIDPARLKQEDPPFPVQITSTLLNGQPANLSGLHLGGPFPKNLEIRYAGLMFGSERLTFRYQLVGYDKTWIDAGVRRAAFYTSLPPGNFEFRVQARTGSGSWVSQSAPLHFSIEPRLVQRPAFWAALVSLLGVLILAGYRLRVRSLTVRFDHVLAERERIARELHDTLLQGLAGITMQLQALSTRLTWAADREQMAGIIEDARTCSSEARRSLMGLRSSRESAEDLASQLEASARRILRNSGATLHLHLERHPAMVPTDLVAQLLRMTQEALFNAARHAQATHINVELRFEPEDLLIVVEDDGIGFDPGVSKRGHFGLVGMRERAKRWGASVEISSVRADGTRVVIRTRHGQRLPATQINEKLTAREPEDWAEEKQF